MNKLLYPPANRKSVHWLYTSSQFHSTEAISSSRAGVLGFPAQVRQQSMIRPATQFSTGAGQVRHRQQCAPLWTKRLTFHSIVAAGGLLSLLRRRGRQLDLFVGHGVGARSWVARGGGSGSPIAATNRSISWPGAGRWRRLMGRHPCHPRRSEIASPACSVRQRRPRARSTNGLGRACQ